MESGSERYTADYGNLLFQVTERAKKGQERVFEYIVTDKRDEFVCWTGSASNLADAQTDAMAEAQIFLDPCYISSAPTPQWRRDEESATQI